MPIFEYQCQSCGKRFESIVIGGDEPKSCELCGARKIKKLMSACGFHTKDKSGLTTKSSPAASSCAGCSSASCASCR